MYQAPRLSEQDRRPAAGPRDPAPAVRRRRRLWWLLKWAFILFVWGSLVGGVGLLWFAWDLPRPEAALDAARRPSLTLQDQSGHVVATFGDVVGDALRLSEMSPSLPAAAVAAEDRPCLRRLPPGLRALHPARAGS